MLRGFRNFFAGLILVTFFLASSCAKQNLTVLSPHSKTVENKSLSPESPYQNIDQIEEGKIIHVPTGIEVSEERMIDLLTMARIAYVGEVHDSLEDHRVQLTILKDLWERFPDKVVVGMEMFRRPAQPKLDQWLSGNLSDKDFLKMWYENWGVNEDYYKEILAFIREKNIPLIALNASQEMEIKVGMKGMDGLSENDKKALPEIDREDPYHRQALEAIFKGHGAGTKGFGSFYDTMLLWDETMAESIVNYLTSSEGADKRMVVFAGGFHVGYGFGIPRRVFRRLPDPYKIIMPYAKDFPEAKQMLNVKAPDLPLSMADFVWGVGYRELESKKVRLGVFIEPFQAGIRVTDVLPESPAAAAGIQTGDIIVSFDGQIIDEPFDLTYAVGQKTPGDRVKLKIIRDGKSLETEAVMKASGHP
ncbi:MAG: ChaN family lipoprotein [Nitrospiria bacterium]